MINKQNFEKYSQLFIEENHKVNLISKNDEKFYGKNTFVTP